MNQENLEEILGNIDISGEAPVLEPDRQYYFMKKARMLVKEKSEDLGRPLTFCVNTFGCQMNARDSEKLVGVLENIGYVEKQDEDADFVIFNTCTVREEKEKSSYDDSPLRMHDAGGPCGGKIEKELFFCQSHFRHTQHL